MDNKKSGAETLRSTVGCSQAGFLSQNQDEIDYKPSESKENKRGKYFHTMNIIKPRQQKNNNFYFFALNINKINEIK